MSNRKSSLWCVAKECNNITEKRHFFLFPKEHDRWLQWIHACGRLDLQVMGPEYGHRNYRLCHLHFEEKWYKIGQKRASLHPDAVPTIFFGRENDKEDEAVIEVVEQQEETNSSIQTSNATLSMDRDAEIAKPSTSSSCKRSRSMCSAAVKETSRQKKWRERHLKLKADNKMLRERLRRLRKKVENLESKAKSQEECKEHEILRQLGCKLLPTNFAQLLSAQIDAQIKSKHGRRYSPEFKRFALSLFFLSPRNYRELRKQFALPSIRGLHSFTHTWQIKPGKKQQNF
ncbi:uncharacterized protein [Temnothorax nylanderi]|uniref:uncharacterized protein n=1 Tax=Temnothorax nylanderi TaxID=102681 RepID=UPI003A848259